jgi:long-chain acyl-CoA synthetase
LQDAEISFLALDAFSATYFEQLDLAKVGISLEEVIYCADSPEAQPAGTLFYEELIIESPPLASADFYEPSPDELAGIYYTGGTTGRAKGVMLSHQNLNLSALHTALGFQYTYQERHLHAAPMFHSADCSQVWGITLVGGAHIFLPAFEPSAVLQAIARYQATTTLLVPTMLYSLLNHPSFSQTNLSSLRRIIYGAAPIDTELLKRAMLNFPCPLWQGLGMAETSPLLCILRPEEHDEAHLTACGRPVAGVDLRIVDEQGQELATGKVGEIVARGNVMQGYWKQLEETERVLQQGFYHSGDLAYRDIDGFIFIVDRKKDMVISGGENIYTIEVERALASHAAVQEVAVFGVPDQKWGEAVHAVVVLKPALTEQPSPDALISHVKTQLASYKAPHSIEIVEVLPKSGAGKILKTELRNKFWLGRERKI